MGAHLHRVALGELGDEIGPWLAPDRVEQGRSSWDRSVTLAVVRTPGSHFDAVQIFPPPFIRSASEVTSIRHGASFRTPKVGSLLPPGQNAIGS